MRKMLCMILAAVVVGMAGCAEKPDRLSYVTIIPEVRTRVTGVHFDNNDQIGLTIMNGATAYAENHKMIYNGTAFAASDLLWYNNLNEKSTLTAYHPYSSTGAPTTFNIASDQRGGCASSDLLAAVKKEVTPGAAPVGMLFYHLMSQLSILTTNQSGAAITSVSVGGFVPVAAVDFLIPTATAKSGVAAASVEAFAVTVNSSYRVILVPQQAALTISIATADGKTHTKTIAAATLESGKRYDLSVTLTPIDILVSLSGDVSDWQDGGALGGGAGTVTYEGQTYTTKTIDGRVWMAENLRYQPAGVAFDNGVWYPVDGAAKVPTVGLLYNRTTALKGASVVPNVAVQGICPSGWHIPDEAELTALIGSSNRGTDFFTCAGFRIVNASDANYGPNSKGYLMSTTLSAGQMVCLFYTTAGAEPTKIPLPPEYGVSLRCVQNAK